MQALHATQAKHREPAHRVPTAGHTAIDDKTPSNTRKRWERCKQPQTMAASSHRAASTSQETRHNAGHPGTASQTDAADTINAAPYTLTKYHTVGTSAQDCQPAGWRSAWRTTVDMPTRCAPAADMHPSIAREFGAQQQHVNVALQNRSRSVLLPQLWQRRGDAATKHHTRPCRPAQHRPQHHNPRHSARNSSITPRQHATGGTRRRLAAGAPAPATTWTAPSPGQVCGEAASGTFYLKVRFGKQRHFQLTAVDPTTNFHRLNTAAVDHAPFCPARFERRHWRRSFQRLQCRR
jgi:hypothetical protein